MTKSPENPKELAPETLAAQALGTVAEGYRDLVPPIHPATTFERAPDGSLPGGRSYTRDQNPTYDAPEALLARLEDGSDALLFSSGMAAAATVLDALPPRAHVVAPRQMYFALRVWLQHRAARGRLELELVSAGDLEALDRALRPGRTALVWLETPANPTAEITDLAAACRRAHEAGARVAVDNTVPTPVLTRPLEHGADLVVHSATKQLNGHSDVLAGALVTAREDDFWEEVRFQRGYRGALPGPFEAWLLLRGMRTLCLRVPRCCDSASRIATRLERHPAVERVLFPGLASHPGHEVARRQMSGRFGFLVSFLAPGGAEEAVALAGRLRLFKRATSLGGVESLVEHRATVEGEASEAPDNLLRLSVGIEDPDDLIADLEQALDG
jgi:cystathionine gamma-synthase